MTDSTQPAPRRAVIDIGSSAIKTAAYDFTTTPPTALHEPDPVATRLGRGLEPGGRLSPDAREATLAVIDDQLEVLERFGIVLRRVVATEAIRIAIDGVDFLDDVRRLVGPAVAVDVITAEQEAAYGYRSCHDDLELGPGGEVDIGKHLLTIDPGGSSNDFAEGRGPAVERSTSLPFGMNRLLEVAPIDEGDGRLEPFVVATLRAELDARYAPLGTWWYDAHPDTPPAHVVAMGGSAVALAAVHLDVQTPGRLARAQAAHGHRLDRRTILELGERLATMTVDERRDRYPCLTPARAAIFLHGVHAYDTMLRTLDVDAMVVNGFGMACGALRDAEATEVT